MARTVDKLTEALLAVTKNGTLTGWCERIAGVVARHHDLSYMETCSQPRFYAETSIRYLAHNLGSAAFEAFDADVAAMEAAMSGADKLELVRVSATIRHIGGRVLDGSVVYVLVLENVRAPGVSAGARLRDSTSGVILTAHASLSPMLALARSARDPLGEGVSEVTLGYVKLNGGPINGEVREFQLHVDE